MRIDQVAVRVFSHTTRRHRDSEGHAHPGPPRQAQLAVLSIEAAGAQGHCLGAPDLLRSELLDAHLRPVLLGADATMREAIWHRLAKRQRGSGGMLTDRTLALVECALWDLAGRALGQPVWRLIGGYRSKVPAYGSTMCGDELPGGLATPDDYARFAIALKARGYQGIKLHTWMPPVGFAPSVAMDIRACAAVREAVGPGYPLMLDANHWYSRREALELGRAIEALGYAWYEEPMEESSVSAYAALARELTIPVLGPEIAWGRLHARAEWISAGACDILRAGVHDVGGITPTLKCAHLAEAFNLECEIHGNGAANLAVLACMANGRFYERGLLHPLLDHDATPEYLLHPADPMDGEGFVHLSELPGLGEEIDWAFVTANTVARY